MDDSQKQTVLRSIALSSSSHASSQDRQIAFQILEQFKGYDGRIPVCIQWLHQERHVLDGGDITVPTKLYILGILDKFLQKGYAGLQENERLALRHAVLSAARQLAPLTISDENRILGNKLASILAALLVRDFPQRWTTFFEEVFVPISMGGLWCDDDMHVMGVVMCLECLKLVTEDCTDSDFNSKISTSRRNDVLIGLNEVSSQFLPLLFGVLEHYSVLVEAKSTLHNMQSFLQSNGRTLSQMTVEESSMYQSQVLLQTQAGRLVADCLVTMERFCYSMPLDWILGARQDFAAAFLHLLREPTAEIQVQAVACLEQLALRKLDSNAWMRFISQLPQAVSDANQVTEEWTIQLDFHRALSRMLAILISANISHITTDKDIVNGRGQSFQNLSSFLRLMVEMIHHPSGRICGEQINTWIGLLRDPQIVKTNLLTPFAEELLTCYMDHIIRVRWEDVEEQTHPHFRILDASWDDEEEYDAWLCDLRSKASQLFKCLGSVEPQVAASAINSRVQTLLARYGNGEPRDHLNTRNNQLTPASEACIQFEALYQPLENILNGVPQWALEGDRNPSIHKLNAKRAEIRVSVHANLSQVANSIVSWTPSYLWLKFRRATLLDALKHYWKYDPSTLLTGIDSLLSYLSAPDEWQPSGNNEGNKLSGEIISLRKKSGVSLVSVSKHVPEHLVPWLSQLSEATKGLLSSNNLLPPSRMHLYEFLSCVATAVEDPVARSNFVADVLSHALNALESPEVRESISTVESFLSSLNIAQAVAYPASVTEPRNVKAVTTRFVTLFSSVNQLLSVGKRCHEAGRKRSKGMVHLEKLSDFNETASNFPDEGPVSIRDLALNDPFVPLWPRILPSLLKIIDVTLRMWHPEHQAVLLQNPIQRYAYAISDDEAYLSQKHESRNGGVFGEGGTAGSVVAGTDRRDANLAPKWSGWLNELRNTCFQLLGLLAGQRVLFAPELSGIFPQFVATVANPDHLRAMEHRHFTQYMKQFIEILMLSCPATLYGSHFAPIARPVFEHIQYRLEKTWAHIVDPGSVSSIPDIGKAISSANSGGAAVLASRGGDEWFVSYYARSGTFVGDLDSVTAEAAVEKYRIEFTRTYCDVLQAALALKGDWALVLANQSKEEQATRRNDPSKLTLGPRTRLGEGGLVNADGTPRDDDYVAVDARKILRISGICHFLLLEDERVAGSITLSMIQCLGYPDAYTCRRCTRICHRILETVAWSPRYTPLLANQMFLVTAKNVVTEPKWMVGIEWDMINLLRDLYCRLVLGQTLQPGGQGPGMQQSRDPSNPLHFEQAKTADRPLQGGGILTVPSDSPRQILASLPGISVSAVKQLEQDMNRKLAAKDQKDFLRDLLRIAAENSQSLDNGRGDGMFDRAIKEESLLNQKIGKLAVPDIPEKLVTHSMMMRKESKRNPQTPEGLAAFHL